MMRADKDEVVRIVEECANGGNFSAAGLLTRSNRVEADHDERVTRIENCAIQWNLRAIVVSAFDLDNGMARLRGAWAMKSAKFAFMM